MMHTSNRPNGVRIWSVLGPLVTWDSPSNEHLKGCRPWVETQLQIFREAKIQHLILSPAGGCKRGRNPGDSRCRPQWASCSTRIQGEKKNDPQSLQSSRDPLLCEQEGQRRPRQLPALPDWCLRSCLHALQMARRSQVTWRVRTPVEAWREGGVLVLGSGGVGEEAAGLEGNGGKYFLILGKKKRINNWEHRELPRCTRGSCRWVFFFFSSRSSTTQINQVAARSHCNSCNLDILPTVPPPSWTAGCGFFCRPVAASQATCSSLSKWFSLPGAVRFLPIFYLFFCSSSGISLRMHNAANKVQY